MENRSRSLMAGMTDYTGVSTDVILAHLNDWRDSTTDTIKNLKRFRNQVETHRNKLDRPNDIIGFIDYFVDLFDRYAGDFARLLAELPRNVNDAHVEMVRQIYESSKLEERLCVTFKQEHIELGLKDESLRWLVDKIYQETRGMIIDYRDLSNLVPRLRTFVGASSILHDQDADRHFAAMAVEEARKSVAEDDRPHPKVGAVVVKNGVVISRAYRGEKIKCHAEYIALEKKLPDELIAGATVYTTLEPCTTRKHPKIPCARRLVDRKVARVVIGMLDPNPEIRGLGDQFLSAAGIETQLFPRELRAQVEEMNRDFIREQVERQKRRRSATPSTDKAAKKPKS